MSARRIPVGPKCSHCGSRDASIGLYGDPWCLWCLGEPPREYAPERAAVILEIEEAQRRVLEEQ